MSYPLFRALWLGLRLGGRTLLLLALGYAAPLVILCAPVPAVGIFAISIALLLGVLPATLIGLLIGAVTGLLVGLFQARLTEKRAAAIGFGVVATMALGLSWLLYPRFASTNFYIFLLAVPSFITLCVSGWLGVKVFRQLQGASSQGSVFRFNLLSILVELIGIVGINSAIIINFSAISNVVILTALVSTLSVGAIGFTLFGANLGALSLDDD